MSVLLFLAIAVGGGVGAGLRLVVDTVVREQVGSAYPWGTWLINVTGSLVLGLVTGLATRGALGDDWRLVLGTGVCGGYTTFSTASLELVRLGRDRRASAAVWHSLGMLVASVAAAGLGLWLGGL